jgi:FkbM family methyltransferase
VGYFKELTKRTVHSIGFDILRLDPGSNSSLALLKSLSRFDIDTVFDVGANIGQFSSGLRSVGFAGKLISFEPLSVAHRVLVASARTDSNWLVHPRSAIGDRDGQIEINVAGNSVSSSVLAMAAAHSSAAEDSAYIGVETVPIARLDSVAPNYLARSQRAFLKIDTQGYEWHVLDGARETLTQMQGVLCELSLIPLYEGQHLWMDVIQRLECEGFTLWSLQKGFTDPRDGRTLQVDAVFFRL